MERSGNNKDIKDARILQLESKLKEGADEIAALESKVAVWTQSSKRNQDGRVQAEASSLALREDLKKATFLLSEAKNSRSIPDDGAIKQENERLKARIQQLESDAKNSSKEYQNDIQTLQTEVYDRKSQLCSTLLLLEEANQKLTGVDKKMQGKDEVIDNLNDEILKLKSTIDTKSLEMNSLKSHIHHLSEQVGKIPGKLEKSAEFKQLKDTCNSLRRKNEVEQDANATLKMEYDELTKANAQLWDAKQELLAKIEELENGSKAADSLQSENDNLLQRLHGTESSLKIVEKQLKEYTEIVPTIERLLELQQSAASRADTEVCSPYSG
jgi:chromosome segregation ATPase